MPEADGRWTDPWTSVVIAIYLVVAVLSFRAMGDLLTAQIVGPRPWPHRH